MCIQYYPARGTPSLVPARPPHQRDLPPVRSSWTANAPQLILARLGERGWGLHQKPFYELPFMHDIEVENEYGLHLLVCTAEQPYHLPAARYVTQNTHSCGFVEEPRPCCRVRSASQNRGARTNYNLVHGPLTLQNLIRASTDSTQASQPTQPHCCFFHSRHSHTLESQSIA